ncbi:hypothetical protein [Gemmatimonas sp.]|uniref:hypothetical protein n=1 Tax=Gemmatimonas sp. TaxID=1962908 RepID=UPI003569AAAC
MYADMLLRLVVVLLGSIIVVTPMVVLANEPRGEVATVATTTTTTTTTTAAPVPLCTRLYTSPAGQSEKKDGIWIEIPNALRGEQLRTKFKEDLELEYAAETGIEGLTTKGIGLLLGYGGYNADSEGPQAGASRSTAIINEIQALWPELFQSTASRPFGTRSVGAGLVGIEVYPLVEGPCS